MMETPQSQPPAAPPAGENIHEAVRRLHILAALVGLAMVAVVAVAVIGLALRAGRPGSGHFAPVVLAGVIALVALAGAVVALELTTRAAGKAPSLAAAAGQYRFGCLIAGGANLVAAAVSLIVLFANGISGRLWVGQVLVLAMNLLGLLLAIPRVGHLRRFHHRDVLPVARI